MKVLIRKIVSQYQDAYKHAIRQTKSRPSKGKISNLKKGEDLAFGDLSKFLSNEEKNSNKSSSTKRS